MKYARRFWKQGLLISVLKICEDTNKYFKPVYFSMESMHELQLMNKIIMTYFYRIVKWFLVASYADNMNLLRSN